MDIGNMRFQNHFKIKKPFKGLFFILFFAVVLYSSPAHAQKGIGVDNPIRTSALEINAQNRGVLIPRVALTALNEFAPITGLQGTDQANNSLLVYNTATSDPSVEDTLRISPGYYYWTTDGTEGNWNRLLVANEDEVKNGLIRDGSAIKLGGALTEPTMLVTNEENSLAITGLEVGDELDYSIVTDEANGVLKKVKQGPRFFYMPSVVFDTDEPGTYTRDLYAEYQKQFEGQTVFVTGENNNTAIGSDPVEYTGGLIRSSNAPDLYVYDREDLFYYVTYFDQEVFETGSLSLSEDGILTYEVISEAPPTAYMNVVFVVKH